MVSGGIMSRLLLLRTNCAAGGVFGRVLHAALRMRKDTRLWACVR